MPLQLLLPGLPEGASRVGVALSILKKDGRLTYFVGGDTYSWHREGDVASYQLTLATLVDNGHVRACELEQALNIPHRTLMNWLRRYREEGPESFYRPARRAGARVLTPEKVAQCERLLAEDLSVPQAARAAGVDASTLRKGLTRGAVRRLELGAPAAAEAASTKSERSRLDAQAAAGMGMACTRADERVAAAVGLADGAVARFEPCRDVALGGLLVGLPALCANGLLSGLGRYLTLPRGFYSALHILVLLGFMALGRLRRPEHLRHVPPGELGKVAGLDRVPEVRTLRAKITHLAQTGHPEAWMKELARIWMEADPEEAGYLYVDGHVRVYHGNLARLPRRYVSRDRLCLRGTTDYWVNDALGRPFFVVSKAVTDGLAATLLEDLVPDLLACVPGQPSEEALAADPLLHRFVVVFDREGAHHRLFAALWKHRIAALSYRKHVTDLWPATEFVETEVPVPGGGSTRMMLAKRQTLLSAGASSLPVLEVRRLTPSGHQTALIGTARLLEAPVLAGRMFSRWCQENYFAYMMEHYDIDGLVQYGAEPLPGTVQVVNPVWRTLDRTVKDRRRTLQKLQAKLGALGEADDGALLDQKAQRLLDVQALQAELDGLKAQRRQTERHVPLETLPEEQRPTQLLPLNKLLADTVKMIAYRAETALVARLLPHLKHEADARALVREILVSAADLEPDDGAGTLTVRLHHMTCPTHDRAVAALLDDLTHEEFHHPETGARMIYALA